jgi:SET domain-containing protein
MPAKKPYRIGRSRTGLGLFANGPIKNRQFIVEYSGRRITAKVADSLERYRRNKFLFSINKDLCIDGTSRRNIGRYVNHSCRPNAEAVIRRGTKRIDYVAARRIKSGEEITVDYGKDYTEMFIETGGCRCGACRRRRTRKRKKQREALLRRRARNTLRRQHGAGRTSRSPGSTRRKARPSRGRTRLAAGSRGR